MLTFLNWRYILPCRMTEFLPHSSVLPGKRNERESHTQRIIWFARIFYLWIFPKPPDLNLEYFLRANCLYGQKWQKKHLKIRTLRNTYLSTDYFGTRQIIFGNNMNAIVPGQRADFMYFYSIHVIAEYNLSGSEIICRQIHVSCKICFGCFIMPYSEIILMGPRRVHPCFFN